MWTDSYAKTTLHKMESCTQTNPPVFRLIPFRDFEEIPSGIIPCGRYHVPGTPLVFIVPYFVYIRRLRMNERFPGNLNIVDGEYMRHTN